MKINTCPFKNTNNKTSPSGTVAKNLPATEGDARDVGSIPGLRISSGVGNGNLLPDSCLEISMDRGGWQATVCEVGLQRLGTDTQVTELDFLD